LTFSVEYLEATAGNKLNGSNQESMGPSNLGICWKKGIRFGDFWKLTGLIFTSMHEF
jgi:hypothetical protein